ncbi:type VI secretion system tip protein VgrG [Roseobacter weihaiensis]|uniref:type VI secretion system tip protein VgrG n=1 Tax=Roseobacter weihaiensis TaxID=2763262 RepID=UPI001D0B6B92|nr:type VI secretion system tip protein VgrG [Roseobacter sp. H9]
MANGPELNTDGPVGVTVKLDGKAMADDIQLQSVRVLHELNRIPEARFTVLSDSLQIEDFTALDSADFAVGTEVEISAFYGDYAEKSLFKGIILTNRARLDGRSGLRMELICRDKAMRLTEVRSSAPYDAMKDSEVMERIIKDAGLTSEITDTKAAAATQLRVGATDWDFLRLLADRNGFALFVEGGKIKAVAPDTSGAAVLSVTYGINIIDLDISLDTHRMIGAAKFSAWTEKDQAVVTDESNTVPAQSFGNTSVSTLAKVLGDREVQTGTAIELASDRLGVMAKARTARAGLAAVRGTVKFQGNGEIRPLDMLQVVGTGDRFSGDGFVSSVEHEIGGGAWTTQVRLGLPPDWTSDAQGLGAPAAAGIATPIHGLQIGKVVALAPDEEGMQRIQVKLPMIGDPAAEVWARFAQPYASKEMGIQFLPEVDDEVLVSFLNADPSAPIVIGSLHNDKAKRPIEATTTNDLKTIVTREKLKMTFDDAKKIITVETPGGHVLTLDDEASSFSLKDMNGNSIVMDSGGISLTTDKDITLKATGNVATEATMDATVTANNVTCEAQIGFTGKGGATAEVSAGGQTKVEGGIVMIN